MNFHHSCENFIGKLVIGKCIMSIFKKGVDPEWGSYTPLHLKSNPVPNPLLLKEWSVANPLHSLHWIGLWSGVSRSEPVSDCYEFFPNCYAYEWPQLWPLIDFAWVCDFVNVRFSKSMAQSRIHRKNTLIANSLATLPPWF